MWGAERLYWVDAGTDKIQRADLDGSNVEDLIITGLSSPTDLAAGCGGRQDVLDGPEHV